MINVDGSVVLHTRGGAQPGKHELKMKVLFWPLKSEEREAEYQKGRFIPSTKPDLDDTDHVEEDILEEVLDSVPGDKSTDEDTSMNFDFPIVDSENSCTSDFVAEIERVKTFYEGDTKSGLLSMGHVGISLIMSDYELTDEDILDDDLAAFASV
jgi:hypothetical protein